MLPQTITYYSPTLTKLTPKVSFEEYMTAELAERAPRCEFMYGEVVELEATTDDHNEIVFNFRTIFKRSSLIKARACKAYHETMKCEILPKEIYFYPDIIVSCHPEDLRNKTLKKHPSLIVEILSDSTEYRDRLVKLGWYFTLESMRYVLLISQTGIKVELFTKDPENLLGYNKTEFTELSQILDLPDLELSFSLQSIYENTDLLTELV